MKNYLQKQLTIWLVVALLGAVALVCAGAYRYEKDSAQHDANLDGSIIYDDNDALPDDRDHKYYSDSPHVVTIENDSDYPMIIISKQIIVERDDHVICVDGDKVWLAENAAACEFKKLEEGQ